MNRFAMLAICSALLASCGDGVKEEAVAGGDEVSSVSDFRQNLVLTEEVFPESVLASWGYETTGFGEGVQSIRSKRDYGSSEVAFYARFSLAKARFSSEAEAERGKDRIEALLETEAGFKDYTQLLRRGQLLYSFSPSGNRVYLGHQPQLLKDAAIYLNLGHAERGGGRQTAAPVDSKSGRSEKLEPKSEGRSQ